MDIPGYQIVQEVLRTGPFIVVRARRMADGRAVLLKRPARLPFGTAEIEALEREHALLQDLRLPGIPGVLDLIRPKGLPCLVLDDPGFVPLGERLRTGPIDLSDFFAIAKRLCTILAAVHARETVVGSVSPATTFVGETAGDLLLLDFSLASRGTHDAARQGLSVSTITAYVSPEQTGRLNRVVDHRSDFYSLGATLYELLTSQPPFRSADSLELIHAHIARTPATPSALLPAVPQQLSRIVMRLLAKAAEDRYQSARGILHDLATCERTWLAEGSIPLFDLGQKDVSEHFLIPQRLYGRDAEMSELLRAFDATCQGETALKLVAGYSGIGKTSLIGELSRRVARQRGSFITGKFDQVVRNIPYGALIQAFRTLIRQWLAEREERLSAWRTRLATALGTNGGVLAEVLPEIELVLGPQPAPTPVDAVEAQNRFRYVFESFVGATAGPDHPLVLFLDDLQWVDAATLDLLSALLTSAEVRHLLVVGAYRDNEVDRDHLLAWAIGRLEASGAPVGRLSLGPLAHRDLVEFLADTLHTQDGEIGQLARLILQKTAGNPFFVIQFLKTLHRQGLFSFDRERNCWTFHLGQIAAAGITDNVIDLMTKRVQQLSPEAQTAITLAACIGNPFALGTYVTASGGTADEALPVLAEIRDAGLIHEAGTAFGSPDHSDSTTYAFLHDRVQQAAYELLPVDRRRTVHLEVGRLLRARSGSEVLEDRLFETVGQLNLGSALIDAPAERVAVARLNLAAGRKAKVSSAYRAAATYMEAGIALLTAAHWASDYDLMFALHLEAAECRYLAGSFDAAESCFETLLRSVQARADRAQVHALRIVLYENQSRFTDAITSGREGLALYGFEFPAENDALQRRLEDEIAAAQTLVGERRIAALVDLPVMQDPDMRTVMRILTTLWAPSYISGNHLLARLISATLVRLSLTHGNTEDSAYGYVTHAITIGPVRRDYQAAYEWGELALRVNERFDDAKRRAKIHQQFHAHVKLWRRPFETCIPHAREARRAGLDAGDFTYAGYAAASESWPAFLASRSLEQFVREYSTAFPLLDRIKMAEFRAALHVVINWAQALRGKTCAPVSLTDSHFNESEYVARFEASAPFFLTFHYTARLHLSVLHGRYHDALDMARHARAVTLPGTIWPVLVDFWESLAIAGAWATVTDDGRRELLPRLDETAQSLRTLASSCPENFRCFALLAAAVRRRIDGQIRAALELTDDAISYARDTDNVQMHALASELGAEIAGASGDVTAAAALLRAAHGSYARWGAIAKTRQLEDQYSQWLGQGEDREPAPATTSLQREGEWASLDMATVLKVARAVAVEIELDGLLRRLLRIALENAGAERALFLEDREGALLVEGEAITEPPAVRVRLSTPVDDQAPFAASVVRYVRRTGQDVVVGNAAADERFSLDPYVADRKVRSLLCVPVSHQGRTTGILYLENNLTTDAFTAQRVEMMRVLAAQAAISLENARLYDGMKAEVERRTRAEHSLRDALSELEVLKNRLEAENVYLQEEIRTQHNFNEIVGNSPALLHALRRVELVAPTESTVLIMGETGSGKELFARAIHSRSRRAERPLVKVNCGAIAPGLVESELFGHVKGAFTGAIDKRLGRFELAHGGTILLDEVGELPLEAQVKLLRVLQEQEFEPVGSSRTVRVDVRVIAATNRDLEQAVRTGGFRPDLLYRLNVFPITVPPLRERRDDVPLLVGLFVSGLARKLGKELQGFSARGMERLMSYHWPGNVRELQNVVERAAIVAPGPLLEVDPSLFTGESAATAEAERSRDGKTLDQVQRSHIVEVLKMTGGVVEGSKGAASILGLHPNTLRSRMKKLGITTSRPAD